MPKLLSTRPIGTTLLAILVMGAFLPACADEGEDAFKVGLVETPHDGAIDGAREAGEAGETTPIEAGEDTGTVPADGVSDTGTPPSDTSTLPSDTGTPPSDTGTPPSDTGTRPSDTGSPPSDTGATGPETFFFPTSTDTEKLKITPRFGDPSDVYEGTRTTKLAKIKVVTVSPVLQNWTSCAGALLTFDVYVNDVKLGTMAVPPGSPSAPGAEVSLSQTFSGLSIASLSDKVTVRYTNSSVVAGCGTVVVVKGKGKVTLE